MNFLRTIFPRLLLLTSSCLALTACDCYEQRNRWAETEYPRTLHLNRAGGGLIRSPYDPDAGLVDVRCLKPGDLAYCPYTGRKFEVPPYGGKEGIAIR